MMMRKRTWYHVSASDHGPELVAARRPPLLRTAAEPLTPRVCVEPSIAGALAAVLCVPRAYVYSVRARAVAPVGVWDASITGERWLIPPVTLSFVRCVDTRDVYAATLLRLEQRLAATWRVRIAQLVIA